MENPYRQPILRDHDGITVVRDDLFLGGTKARFLPLLFKDREEVVYASPCEGGAQTALAWTARRLKKRATIFLAKRKTPHERALEAKAAGAKIFQVNPGYLNNVRAKAQLYCQSNGAFMAPFGMDTDPFIEAVAQCARTIDFDPDEVWCAAGSGVLARGLRMAFPRARRFVVQIGRTVNPDEIGNAGIIAHYLPFEKECKTRPPFPSDPHYDAKAWEICKAQRGPGKVLFWNVTGPADRARRPDALPA